MVGNVLTVAVLCGLVAGSFAGTSGSPPGCTIGFSDQNTACTSDGQCCDEPGSGGGGGQDRCCRVGITNGVQADSGTCGPVPSTSANGQVGPYVCQGSGGSSGDPVLSGFDGSTFQFQGLPYAYFNLIAERDHQLNAFFTPAVMHDHNGTYITALGLKYDVHQVAIRVLEDGMLTVELNGKPLTIEENENSVSLTLRNKDNDAEMVITWQLYQAGLGQTVTVSTPLMNFMAWAVAAGTVDAGGVVQPAYLNTRFTLLQAPAGNRMDGVLGRTYNRLVQNIVNGTPAPTEMSEVTPEEVAYCRVFGLMDRPASRPAEPRLQLTSAHRMLLQAGRNSAMLFPVSAVVHGRP